MELFGFFSRWFCCNVELLICTFQQVWVVVGVSAATADIQPAIKKSETEKSAL